MAVGGSRETRHGIILAKNEKAKAFGIVTAETIGSALSKCPELVIVPPRHRLYEDYSRRINAIYGEYTDLVEKFGIDESWLDVTGSVGLFGDGVTIAGILRSRIREEIGVTISVGVSFNKVFAKLGSDMKKPDATTVLLRENYKEKIYPLPADSLLYVGKNTYEALRRLGIFTIGDLASANEKILTDRFGKQGTQLYRAAAGLSDDPVHSMYEEREVKSVGNGRTFAHDLTDRAEIRTMLYPLCEEVAYRLREKGLQATTLQLTIRDPEFHTVTRLAPIGRTASAHELLSGAMAILDANRQEGAPVRMLTVTAQNLIASDAPEQLSLFDDAGSERHEKVDAALDGIRKKYGNSSVVRARQLKK